MWQSAKLQISSSHQTHHHSNKYNSLIHHGQSVSQCTLRSQHPTLEHSCHYCMTQPCCHRWRSCNDRPAHHMHVAISQLANLILAPNPPPFQQIQLPDLSSPVSVAMHTPLPASHT